MNQITRQRRSLVVAFISLLAVSTDAVSQVAAQTAAGNASFSSATDQNLLTYDFGTHLAGADLSFNFSVFNLPQGAGTASLTLTDVSAIGDSSAIQLQHSPISGLGAGGSEPLSLVLKRNIFGDFAVNFLLKFSNDGLPAEPLQLITVSGFGRVILGGDVDADNDVDGADFLVWQRGKGVGPNATLEDGDANLDGYVNADDLALWRTNYGSIATPSEPVAFAPVPEPSSGLLLLVAAGLGAAIRKRRHPASFVTPSRG